MHATLENPQLRFVSISREERGYLIAITLFTINLYQPNGGKNTAFLITNHGILLVLLYCNFPLELKQLLSSNNEAKAAGIMVCALRSRYLYRMLMMEKLIICNVFFANCFRVRGKFSPLSKCIKYQGKRRIN